MALVRGLVAFHGAQKLVVDLVAFMAFKNRGFGCIIEGSWISVVVLVKGFGMVSISSHISTYN